MMGSVTCDACGAEVVDTFDPPERPERPGPARSGDHALAVENVCARCHVLMRIEHHLQRLADAVDGWSPRW